MVQRICTWVTNKYSYISLKEAVIEFAKYLLKQISIGMSLFGANTFGPLEKLLVGLQGSGRSCLKGLSKTNIFMWY